MRMLKTFFRELMTQSKTAFSLGTLLMVLRGLSTLSTLRLFITARFSAPELPLQGGFSNRPGQSVSVRNRGEKVVAFNLGSCRDDVDVVKPNG